MIKEVEICGKSYTLKSSVGTIKDFKQEFGKDYAQVLQRFIKTQQKAKELGGDDASMFWLGQIAKMNEDVLSLAYIMIKEAKQIGENKDFDYTYDEWLKSLDSIDPSGFMGVLETANAVFQRQVHKPTRRKAEQ